MLVAELSLAQNAPLPGGNLGHQIGQQAQAIIRRQDRHADQVADGGQHEQALEAGPHLESVLAEIQAHHPKQEVGQALAQTAFLAQRLCVLLTRRIGYTLIGTLCS